ncbi:hypothetical protein MRY87_13645 [bacterium]|nr:hypothetical protein [bacterium]
MSSLFSCPSGGATFLSLLSSRLDEKDFEELKGEGGFGPPDYFPVERIEAVVREQAFPEGELGEYQWAITECDRERLARLPVALQVLLSVIYLVSSRKEPTGAALQSDHFLLSFSLARDHGLLAPYRSFLEWLYGAVPPSDESDEYFLFLTWLLASFSLEEYEETQVRQVCDYLLARDYSREDQTIMSDGTTGVEDWEKAFSALTLKPTFRDDLTLLFTG